MNKKLKKLTTNLLIISFINIHLSISYADVVLTVGDGLGYPGSQGNKVEVILDNQDDEVGAVRLDVCDVDDYLSCTGCETTERTLDFTCLCYEQKNGCAGIVLYSPICEMIEKDVGPIFTISYNVSEVAPIGECRDLNPQNVVVTDMFGTELAETSYPGKFCFIACGDVCPPGDPTILDCGDNLVDIYDVLCEVNFVLTATEPNSCQVIRADVPTGKPPDCMAPDGIINILDVMVLIDRALGIHECCTFFYTGRIY